MIILPDRNIPRSRILVPIPDREWKTPFHALAKDGFGQENRTRFRVRARLNDGHVIWCGWFESREDFDAFLFAIFTGELWDYGSNAKFLPTPYWPGLDPAIGYDFATVTFLTSPTGSNQTGFTVPSDWNNANNSIETIGAGASGAAATGTGSLRTATGGGAGAWNLKTNLTLSIGATPTWQLGTGGVFVSVISSSATANGNAGGDTWFNNTTLAGSSVGSKGGVGGTASNNVATNGGAGGVGASGTGSSSHNGGRGGNITAGFGDSTGGGGAAGSTGVGTNGTDTGTNRAATSGGSGDAGAGGAGGTVGAGQNGGNGSEWTATAGGTAGSGGGGASNTTTDTAGNTAGSGGNYGAGGGAATINNCTTTRNANSGNGKQGIIVITNTPATYGFPFLGNIVFRHMIVR